MSKSPRLPSNSSNELEGTKTLKHAVKKHSTNFQILETIEEKESPQKRLTKTLEDFEP